MRAEDFLNIINQEGEVSNRLTFAEVIGKILKDKIVEIFSGDVSEEMLNSDFSRNSFSTICGKVVAGYGDCLLLNAVYVDEVSKEIGIGNLIFVNGFNIKALTEVDGKGTLLNVLLDSKQNAKLKKVFNKKK